MMDAGDALWKQIAIHLRDFGEQIRDWIAQPLSRGNLIRSAVALACGLSLLYCWCARDWLLSRLLRLCKQRQASDPVRRQAARYLRRVRDKQRTLNAGDANQLARYRDLVANLQALRFGPQVSAQSAQSVFTEARRILRGRGAR